MYKFEIYKDKAGEFRFRFKASNGETMFSSEGYKAKASAVNAIESIKKTRRARRPTTRRRRPPEKPLQDRDTLCKVKRIARWPQDGRQD